MDKITVRKKVYWNAAGKMMSGIVKQIFSSHALVAAEDCDYMVQKTCLKRSPCVGKVATLMRSASAEEEMGVTGFVLKFNIKPGDKIAEVTWGWIDPVTGKPGLRKPCNRPAVYRVDAAFKRGASSVKELPRPANWQEIQGPKVTLPDLEVSAPQEVPIGPVVTETQQDPSAPQIAHGPMQSGV